MPVGAPDELSAVLLAERLGRGCPGCGARLVLKARNAPSRQFRMSDIEAHRHRYRSPIAAIVGLAESALLREDLDAELLKQLQAIRALAQEALAADDVREGTTEEARNSPEG